MSWTLHELLGSRYPVYYCPHCETSFIHPAEDPAGCGVCGDGRCVHEGHEPLSRARESVRLPFWRLV